MRYVILLFLLCVAGSALAQGYAPPPPRGPVSIRTLDGGVPVTWSGAPTVQVGLPDGGVQSLQATVAGTVAVSSAPPVTVASAPPVTGTVAVSSVPPITGTVGIGSSIRLDTNITNAFVPVAGDSAGARLEVAVPTGVTATISGTPNVSVTNIPTVALQNGTQVALTSASLATLTSATGKGSCTYVETDLAPGATATAMPTSPMGSRTAVTVTNHTSNRTFKCVPGGTASATLGKVLAINGGYWKWEGAQAGWTLTCICLNNVTPATGCVGQIEEERCYQ